MNAGNDLADASLDAGAVSKFGDILASPTDDDASVFCADEGAEGESLVLGGRRRTGVRRGGGGVGGHGWRRGKAGWRSGGMRVQIFGDGRTLYCNRNTTSS